jgi:hypothetical protein
MFGQDSAHHVTPELGPEYEQHLNQGMSWFKAPFPFQFLLQWSNFGPFTLQIPTFQSLILSSKRPIILTIE